MKEKKIDEVYFSRARDFYLYTSDGTRYLDMHLNDAQALLGHKMTGFGTGVKRVLDKGLLSDVLQIWTIRCRQYIEKCFNDFSHNDGVDKWSLGAWYYVFSKSFDNVKTDTCITILRPYCGVSFSEATKNYTKICYVVPRVWSPMIVPLIYNNKTTDKNALKDVYMGVDEITKVKTTLIKTDKISALDSMSFCYAVRALIKSGLVHRPYPTQAKNRKDIFSVKLQTEDKKNCKKNTNSIHNSRNTKKYKYIKNVELELLPQWKRYGIYIVLPDMDFEAYKKIQKICFFYNIFVPSQNVPWVIPPYFTKQELHNWTKALLEIKQDVNCE